MRIAIYPGSFGPITNGHIEILKRALTVFDKVILLLAVNPNKTSIFSVEDKLYMMEEATKGMLNVEVDYSSGLTVDYCKQKGAKHIIRGLRAVTDFEYEFQMSSANHFLDPEIDMVFFMASTENMFVSSSTVLELWKNGADIAPLVPDAVIKVLEKKKR